MSAIVLSKTTMTVLRFIEKAFEAQFGKEAKILAMSIRRKEWPHHQKDAKTRTIDFYIDGMCQTSPDKGPRFSFKLTMTSGMGDEASLEVMEHLKHTVIIGERPTLDIACFQYHVIWQSQSFCHVMM